MKKYTFILSFILLTFSCGKAPIDNPAQLPGKTATVEFRFNAPRMALTRSLDSSQEEAVNDLNLWLFHRTHPENSRHYFLISETSISLSLKEGIYDYYCIANAGVDLKDKSQDDITSYRIPIRSEKDIEKGQCLPMSAQGSFSADTTFSIPVQLIRCAAKIELSINVTPAFASEITIHSVQILNTPSETTCFAENHTDEIKTFLNYVPRPVTDNSFEGSFYVPENLAGTVNSITTPQFKSWLFAPQNALCICITGTNAEGGKVEYSIFPGENDTSDFNVRRNGRYNISATIIGNNSIDYRISTTQLTAINWWEVYATGETAESLVYLVGSYNPADNLTLSYRLLEGSGTVTVDGIPQSTDKPLVVLPGGNSKNLKIGYTQCAEGNARLQLILRDNEGYTIEKELTTRFESVINLYAAASPPSINGLPVPYTLTIEKPCYSGGFHIQFSDEGAPCTFSLNGITGTEFDVPDGSSRTYMVTPPPQTQGYILFRVTVGTYVGDPHSKTIFGTIQGVIQP